MSGGSPGHIRIESLAVVVDLDDQVSVVHVYLDTDQTCVGVLGRIRDRFADDLVQGGQLGVAHDVEVALGRRLDADLPALRDTSHVGQDPLPRRCGGIVFARQVEQDAAEVEQRSPQLRRGFVECARDAGLVANRGSESLQLEERSGDGLREIVVDLPGPSIALDVEPVGNGRVRVGERVSSDAECPAHGGKRGRRHDFVCAPGEDEFHAVVRCERADEMGTGCRGDDAQLLHRCRVDHGGAVESAEVGSHAARHDRRSLCVGPAADPHPSAVLVDADEFVDAERGCCAGQDRRVGCVAAVQSASDRVEGVHRSVSSVGRLVVVRGPDREHDQTLRPPLHHVDEGRGAVADRRDGVGPEQTSDATARVRCLFTGDIPALYLLHVVAFRWTFGLVPFRSNSPWA